MFRFSVLLLFVLTSDVIAKPLTLQDKLANEAVQKGWVSIDDKGMASWRVEVEPPEDMDETSFDIDPSMKIWKRVQTEQGKQYQMAEGDLDDLQHPSVLDALPSADDQLQHEPKHPLREPEQDMDDVYHSEKEGSQYIAPLAVAYEGAPVFRGPYTEPEEDRDDLYHADVGSYVRVVPLEPEMEPLPQGRLHLEPEEDMDDIYHRDIPELLLYNIEAQPAAGAVEDWPGLRKHTEPEEDRDHIYHN